MAKIPAYAALTAGAPLAPFSIERRDPGPHDVVIDILYAGICHSDIHQKINEAYERMLRGDVRYRFVIDIATLKD